MSYDSQEFSETLKPNLEKIKPPKPTGPQIWTPRPSDANPPEILQMRQIFGNYSPIHLTENSNTHHPESLDHSLSYSQVPGQTPLQLDEDSIFQGVTKTTMPKALRNPGAVKTPLVEGVFVLSADKSALTFDFEQSR